MGRLNLKKIINKKNNKNLHGTRAHGARVRGARVPKRHYRAPEFFFFFLIFSLL